MFTFAFVIRFVSTQPGKGARFDLNLGFGKKTNLYDRTFKNSEPFCMKIREFLAYVNEFHLFEDARSIWMEISLVMIKILKKKLPIYQN